MKQNSIQQSFFAFAILCAPVCFCVAQGVKFESMAPKGSALIISAKDANASMMRYAESPIGQIMRHSSVQNHFRNLESMRRKSLGQDQQAPQFSLSAMKNLMLSNSGCWSGLTMVHVLILPARSLTQSFEKWKRNLANHSSRLKLRVGLRRCVSFYPAIKKAQILKILNRQVAAVRAGWTHSVR
jgi:hypothetical protein